MTKFIASIICMVLIISIFGCSKPTKTVSNMKHDDDSADTKKVSKQIDLFDLSSNIFEDMETQFQDSSIILESLQRNKKGTTIEAKIAQVNAKTAVPQVVLLLSENFKRLEKINILIGADETPYTINVDIVNLLSEDNQDNDLKNAIWDEISSNRKESPVAKTVEDSPKSAGI